MTSRQSKKVKYKKTNSEKTRLQYMRIQYMIQNKTQVEAVNFRLHFKVIFRQNEIQYFTTQYNAEREHLSCGPEKVLSKRSET